MNLRPRALIAEPSTWLAALICAGLCALAWFGYRAANQWQRSAALLADHRGREAADLPRALIRDMSGVQTSILPSPEQNRHAFDPPYDANDLVALAFARYPYPEFFFGWTPSSGGTVMFARTDRLPPWISAHERADVYPVEVRRDPSEIERCGGASKRTSPTGAGIRCSTPRSGGALSSDRARRVRGDDDGNGWTACSAWR